MQQFDLLPKFLVVPDACLLMILMPGARIEIQLMQLFADVYSCDVCHARTGRAVASGGSAGTIPNTLLAVEVAIR